MSNQRLDTEMWLSRLRDGETAVLAELFGYYRPRLRRMLQLRIGRQLAVRVDPSDVLQEVYLDATNKVTHYLQDPGVSLFVWLRGLTFDRLLKLQRHHLGAERRAAERELRLPERSSAVLALKLLAPGGRPSSAAVQAELQGRVQRALNVLGQADREVILMRHFEEMSNKEVAEALGLTASGATMRHGRALSRLKEILEAGSSLEEAP